MQAADLVVSYGGSLSGEHGDGQSKAEFLPKMFGDELVQAFREFKSIWDPDWKMNPGKIVDAYLPTENLRLGTGYNPPQPDTYFKYPKDKGNFGRVTLRCVGIGNCRQQHSQTMCPSYKVTREEKHSTRGRARLLFETMRGEVIKDMWQSEEMKESLDLCLACKGCKGDCPVNVDMATYKAEFLSHYYEHPPAPPPGLRVWLDRPLGQACGLCAGDGQLAYANTGAEQPGEEYCGDAATAHRSPFCTGNVPELVQATASSAMKISRPSFSGRIRSIITFHPETAKAAVAVLEAAGFQVRVPARHVCCGRPLYDFGMLDQAKKQLRRIFDAICEQDIDNGVPVVGMEPACVAVFRDEMVNLFPGDEVAKRLNRQTYFFSEFLLKKGATFLLSAACA